MIFLVLETLLAPYGACDFSFRTLIFGPFLTHRGRKLSPHCCAFLSYIFDVQQHKTNRLKTFCVTEKIQKILMKSVKIRKLCSDCFLSRVLIGFPILITEIRPFSTLNGLVAELRLSEEPEC